MANYTIIGGDKKEYGPVTSEEIRQWVTEGRLDGNTQARSDNDTEWRPLSTFPEFSLLFQSRPQFPPPLNSIRKTVSVDAGAEVKGPAISLIVIGSLSVIFSLYKVLIDLFQPESLDQAMAELNSLVQSLPSDMQKSLNDPQVQNMLHLGTSRWLTVGYDVLALVMSVVIVVGAVRMLALRSYEFAFVAAILAMLPCVTPCPCCVLGLPIGIWALTVLKRPGIRDQFN